jgi:AmmeMemoRadiSam system protein B
VLVNVDIVAKLVATKGVTINDQAHKLEHAIEVQLPFLQLSLDKFDIVPLIVGDISAEALAELILPFWRDPASVLIVSSDLSHYSPLAEAIDHDKETIQRLQDLASDLVGEDACGFRAINGLMHLLCQEGGSVRLLEYGNSADASGDKSRVVGYGSFAVYPDT